MCVFISNYPLHIQRKILIIYDQNGINTMNVFLVEINISFCRTGRLIHSIIKRVFADQTVLTLANNPKFIMDSDLFMVGFFYFFIRCLHTCRST